MEGLTPQELFDDLLRHYKALNSPGTWFYVNPHHYKITIMESGIFHKGGLSALQRGHIRTGGKSHYPIKNLQSFVEELSSLFDFWICKFEIGGFKKEIEQDWKRFQNDFDNFSEYLIGCKIAKKRRINKVRDQFEKWKNDHLAKRGEMHFSSLDTRFKIAENKLSNEVFKVFIKHLPNVPNDTICRRCAELLVKIGLATKGKEQTLKETLRRRFTRAKTKTPTK